MSEITNKELAKMLLSYVPKGDGYNSEFANVLSDAAERLAADSGTQPQQPAPDEMATDIISKLLDYAWRKTCTHEETHRGGFLWEICDSCGMKWADDEGGRPEFETPKAIMDAEVYLAKIRDGKLTTESQDCETIKRYCLKFCKYLSKRGVLCSMFGPEKLAEQFLQQQSAEGGE